MTRKIYYWKLRTRELQLGERTLIMGVLNVTPDSFHDGGKYLDPDRAFARAIEMEEQGADIIDIGAESTRPDAKRISADEEWQRLVPVLKRLRDKLEVPLSIDTYKAEIAERALEYGIEIINDPSGLTFDPDLAKAAANGNAGLILNHMRGTPESWAKLPPLSDVMGTVVKDLDATASRARRVGVEKNRIVLDPGLGFGKRKEQNSEILAQLGRLAALDYPVLAAPSRKAFLAHVVESGMEIEATAAAVAAAVLNGAHIVRVHDVREMKAVALVADEIVRAGAAAERAAERAAEFEKPRARAPRSMPVYRGQEKATPARPPLAPVEKAESVEAPPVSDAATEQIQPATAPAEMPPHRESEDRPVKWAATGRPPRRDDGGKPRWTPGGKPPRRDGDRPPPRDSGDKPRWTPGGKPPRRDGDRPPRRDSGDKPRWTPGGKPPRRDGDRPPPRDSGDKPRWTPGGKPPRRDGDRPVPKRSGDKPAPGKWQGRDDRGPKGKPGDRPFRGGPPSGRPPSGRPPASGKPSGRPPSGRPPRPFRKRP